MFHPLTSLMGLTNSGWIITFNFDFSLKLECAVGPFQLWTAKTLLLETENILRNFLWKIQARKIDHLTSVSSVHHDLTSGDDKLTLEKADFGQKHFIFTDRLSVNIFKEGFRMSMWTTLALIVLLNSFLSSGEDLAGSMNTMNRIPFQWNVVYNIRNNPLLLQLILQELNFITLPWDSEARWNVLGQEVFLWHF